METPVRRDLRGGPAARGPQPAAVSPASPGESPAMARRISVLRHRIATSGAALSVLLILAACSAETPTQAPKVSREPVSVRGWIDDIDAGRPDGVFRTVETEKARRAEAFQGTNMWVEGAPYVSGAVAENGAFILLDVPPGRTAISFAAPGINQADLVLEDVPANADVLIPGLVLRPDGVGLADPKAVRIRIAANVSSPRPTKLTAKVAGVPVPVVEVPVRELIDRRDYPATPGDAAQVPTVK